MLYMVNIYIQIDPYIMYIDDHIIISKNHVFLKNSSVQFIKLQLLSATVSSQRVQSICPYTLTDLNALS